MTRLDFRTAIGAAAAALAGGLAPFVSPMELARAQIAPRQEQPAPTAPEEEPERSAQRYALDIGGLRLMVKSERRTNVAERT